MHPVASGNLAAGPHDDETLIKPCIIPRPGDDRRRRGGQECRGPWPLARHGPRGSGDGRPDQGPALTRGGQEPAVCNAITKNN